MKKNKNAFTIPELLIFMTIVGVVSMAMMAVVKPTERYLPYAYYHAYNTLSLAAMNVREDALNNNLDGDPEISDEDKYFPGALESQTATPAAQELCKKFAIQAATADQYGYINTTEYKCTSFTPLDANGGFNDSTDKSKYAFRASNSMLFYISNKGTLNNIDDDLSITGAKATIDYFIVWVDLNGDRRPNTSVWSPSKSADIVPFIVTTGGQVLPAGGPITDIRYTTARVQYATETMNKYLPRSTCYLEAQRRAYGDKQYPLYDQYSISTAFHSAFSKTLYSKNQKEINAIINKVDVDEKCDTSVEDNYICTIKVDENAKL